MVVTVTAVVFIATLVLYSTLHALTQVDAMVDLRSRVDGFEFEAFPWSERCEITLTFFFVPFGVFVQGHT